MRSNSLGNISFAKEVYLNQYLGINPGSVSPFALLNDKNNDVSFYLEKTLHDSEFVNFHPLINTVTITITTRGFIKFMIENNKKIHIFSSITVRLLNTPLEFVLHQNTKQIGALQSKRSRRVTE